MKKAFGRYQKLLRNIIFKKMLKNIIILFFIALATVIVDKNTPNYSGWPVGQVGWNSAQNFTTRSDQSILRKIYLNRKI
jgi:hypothetical protein